MSEITEISTPQLAELIASGQPVDLIDVRTPEEFAAVRAKTACSVPLDTVNVATINDARTAGEDQPIYIICKVGGRSRMACEYLAEQGLKNLVNVAGGTDAWVEAGLPLAK